MLPKVVDPDRSRAAELWARWHALILAPGLLMLGGLLLFSDRIWALRGRTRSGAPGLSLGVEALLIAAVVVAVYFIGPLAARYPTYIRGRASTAGELKVLGMTLRFGAVVVLYGMVLLLGSKIG